MTKSEKDVVQRALEEKVAKLTDQAQIFASSWSLAGGRFDDGTMLGTAKDEKACLKNAIRAAIAQTVPPTALQPLTDEEIKKLQQVYETRAWSATTWFAELVRDIEAALKVVQPVEPTEDEKDAEIARLTVCLKAANADAEKFEREWYLRGDELEAIAQPALPTAADFGNFLDSQEFFELMQAYRRRHTPMDAAKEFEAVRFALFAAIAQPTVQWKELTDIDRQKVFESLPDMLDGFLKTWGWLHFAKGIEAKCREKNNAQPAPAIRQGGAV